MYMSLVSFFTDFYTEMVMFVLPLYIIVIFEALGSSDSFELFKG